jgi:hypothetical protein
LDSRHANIRTALLIQGKSRSPGVKRPAPVPSGLNKRSTAMTGGSITILSPISVPDVRRVGLKPRPKSMQGLHIAVVDNTKPNFDIFMDRVQEIMEERFGAIFHRYRKPGRTVGVSSEVMDEIKAKCDFAITGLGD